MKKNIWDYWGGDEDKRTNEKVCSLKKIIFDNCASNPNKTESEIYAKAVEDLETIQRTCIHRWDVVKLFTSVKTICFICDKEKI